jgi:RNA polymerase sigma factor (sigma-70 family)
MAVPEQSQTSISADTAAMGGQPGPGVVIPWNTVPAYARKIARGFCQDGLAHLEDDIVQEASLRLFKSSNQIRTSWKGFLRRTVANVAHDLIGHEMRLRRLIRQDQQALAESPSADPEAPDLVATAELEGKLEVEFEAMLAELDVKFGLGTRAIVELRAEKVPWEEIAQALEIPLRTCSYRHGKAEAWLRKKLSLPPQKGGNDE